MRLVSPRRYLTSTAAATVTASAAGGSNGALSGTVNVTVKTRGVPTVSGPTNAVSVSAPASFTVSVPDDVVVTKVTIDFGDGDQQDLGALVGQRTVQHYYGGDGVYDVRVTAVDAEGVANTSGTSVAIVALNASGSVSPTSVLLGLPQVFTVTLSSQTASIKKYIWNFGDGNTFETVSPQQTYTFSQRGQKIVTVTIVPTKGDSFNVVIVADVS